MNTVNLLINTQQRKLGAEIMKAQNPLGILFDSGCTKKLSLQIVCNGIEGTQSYSLKDLHSAGKFVEERCSRGHGVSVVATSFATIPEACRLGGHIGFVWADIRYACNPQLLRPFPQTREHAEQLLQKFPLPPSLTLHTQGLIQSFWLLRRPIVTKSETERMRAKILVTRVQDYFSAAATEDYWEYESTCDLNHRIILSRRGTEPTQPLEVASVLEVRPDFRYSARDIVAACNAGHACCKENWNARFPRKSNNRGDKK